MLKKCANPICPNPFRRLNQGKLFRVEREPSAAVMPRPLAAPVRRTRLPRRVEYYWLCDQCSPILTLIFEKGQGMLTVPLPTTKRIPVAIQGRARQT